MEKSSTNVLGRPPLPVGQKRRPYGIPLSADELGLIREAAERLGVPVTVLVRGAAVDAAGQINSVSVMPSGGYDPSTGEFNV